MDVMTAIKGHHSIRAYRDEPVTKDPIISVSQERR